MQKPTDIFQSTSCLTDEQLMRYVKQELSAAEKRIVELHLADCEMCSDALEGLLAASSDLTKVQQELHTKIDERTKRKAIVIPMRRRWYFSAAAAVVLLALTFAVLNKYINKTQTATVVSENKAAVKLDSIISTEKNITQPEVQSETLRSTNFKETLAVKKPVKNLEQKYNVTEKQADKEVASNVERSDDRGHEEAFDKPAVNEDLKRSNTKQVADSVTVTLNAQGAVANTIDMNKDLQVASKMEESTNYYAAPEVVLSDKKLKSYKSVSAAPSQNGFTDNKPLVAIDESKYNKALSLYNKQDYKNALPLFLQIINQSPDHIECNYFAGLCYYNLNNFKSAIPYLNMASKNKFNNYYEPALWYKSQSLIKLNENKKAAKILQEIITLKGNYKKQAEDTLKQIQ